MKKILALLLTIIMALAVFAGCSDPLYDDFENFLNVEMTEVNANYEKIKEEAASWADIEDDAGLVASLEVLIPLVDDSLAKLENINPATQEVQDLKAKYVKVMDAYKAGFEGILAGMNAGDAAQLEAANEKINEGVALLDEYNAGLEALAQQVGAEIEY